MGRCKSLGSPKSFLWCAPQLSGACILCFHILSFLKAHQLTISCGCNRWWLTSSVYWYGRQYSIYQLAAWEDSVVRLHRGTETQKRGESLRKREKVNTWTRAEAVQMWFLLEMLSTMSQASQWRRVWRMTLGQSSSFCLGQLPSFTKWGRGGSKIGVLMKAWNQLLAIGLWGVCRTSRWKRPLGGCQKPVVFEQDLVSDTDLWRHQREWEMTNLEDNI